MFAIVLAVLSRDVNDFLGISSYNRNPEPSTLNPQA